MKLNIRSSSGLTLSVLILTSSIGAYNSGCLPLLANSNLCAYAPGIRASNGFDEVCNFAEECCTDWVGTGAFGTTTLGTGATVDCTSVNCPNVCRLACEKELLGIDACRTLCSVAPSVGKAVVPINHHGAFGLGHTGFGFEVAPDYYLFGGLENPTGAPSLHVNTNNGFWDDNGNGVTMLNFFHAPPIGDRYSRRHKSIDVPSPNVCHAVRTMESVYHWGYHIPHRDSLDATHNILLDYGAPFLPPPVVGSPNLWYNLLIWPSHKYPMV